MRGGEMKLIKQTIRKLVRRLGYDIVPLKNKPVLNSATPSSYAGRRNHWLEVLGISLLLDVGANSGQYAQEARRHGYKNRIVSFEPLSDAFAQLQRATLGDAQWQCLNIALGDADGTREINIAGNSGESSSLLPMRERHVRALPISAYVGNESIQIARLDSLRFRLSRPDDAIWLKIDVQGYEHKVLEGASNLLAQVKAIEMELSLVPLYDGSPLLCESIAYLSEKGFQLVAVEEMFHDPQRGHTLQINGVFERVSPAFVKTPQLA
jgi:FkbM family methyltransferase